jgi:site-specific recombinase XerD
MRALGTSTCHIHWSANTPIEAGYDIRTVHELLGYKDVSTTMISTHLFNRSGCRVKSPADLLEAMC